MSEDKWQTGEWEDFSIVVVPNDAESTSARTSTSEKVSEKAQISEDIFSDMEPVIKKAKQVYANLYRSGQQLLGINFMSDSNGG